MVIVCDWWRGGEIVVHALVCRRQRGKKCHYQRFSCFWTTHVCVKIHRITNEPWGKVFGQTQAANRLLALWPCAEGKRTDLPSLQWRGRFEGSGCRHGDRAAGKLTMCLGCFCCQQHQTMSPATRLPAVTPFPLPCTFHTASHTLVTGEADFVHTVSRIAPVSTSVKMTQVYVQNRLNKKKNDKM